MRSKDRVLAAIHHKQVDAIPCGEIYIDDDVVSATVACERVGFEQRRDFISLIGLDLVCVAHRLSLGNHMLSNIPDDALHWPDLSRWVRETELAVFAVLDGPMGWGMRVLGFNSLMCAFGRKSADLLHLIQNVESLNQRLASLAMAIGVDGIILADDIAYNLGPFVSPERLKETYFPSLGRHVATVHNLDLPVFFHSDGDLNLLLDDIVASGFDGLQGIERASGMKLNSIYDQYGSQLCLWGNMSPDDLVLPREPEELLTTVKTIVPPLAFNGGYIFGTSSGIVKGSRPESLQIVYRLIHGLPL